MTKPRTSSYLKRSQRIAKGEQDSIVERWRYGCDLLKERGGRKQLPHGKVEYLIKEAADNGLKLTERDLQRYMKCASVYATEAQVRRASDGLSWTAFHETGFPAVEIDPDEIAEALPGPADWEQPSLIPGLKSEFKVNGKKLATTEALVADGEAYEEMCISMHEGYGKVVDQVRQSMHYVRLGSNGDRSMNLVEAYRRGIASSA